MEISNASDLQRERYMKQSKESTRNNEFRLIRGFFLLAFLLLWRRSHFSLK
jgi:hypothetical protein